jgi:thiol-disulfide isomerase/thioredoxin
MVGVVLVLALVAAGMRSNGQSPDDRICVQSVSYEGLGQLVRGLKGKVVVVDFWADFCPPCKAAFKHLVELHNKYGAKGVVAVSVALDDPGNRETRGAIERFLTRQQAYFLNVILDAQPEEWQRRLKIVGPPCVYVFNQDNNIVQKLNDDAIDYDKIEAEVVKLLHK